MTTDPERSKTVINALDILKAFADQPEWRLVDLGRALDLPPSVLHRLVRTLVDAAFLEQPMPRGPYVLGPTLAALAQTAERRRSLTSLAHQHLVALAEALDEAVDLCVLRGERYVCVDTVDDRNRARSVINVGDSMGLHAGAAGKAILAFQSESFIEHVLAGPLLRMTDHTLSERQALADELVEVRRQGYAYSESEVTPGTCSLAAPVRNGAGEVVASINVFTTSDRMTATRRKATVAQLLPVAAELSKSLGHTWLEP